MLKARKSRLQPLLQAEFKGECTEFLKLSSVGHLYWDHLQSLQMQGPGCSLDSLNRAEGWGLALLI